MKPNKKVPKLDQSAQFATSRKFRDHIMHAFYVQFGQHTDETTIDNICIVLNQYGYLEIEGIEGDECPNKES